MYFCLVAFRGQDGAKRPRLETTEVQKAKEQFQARLDASKEDAITTENISSLSDKLSVEKIAAIKAKRLAKKKNTIKIVSNYVSLSAKFM